MSASARVLVVDDEPSARKTVCALLGREGYELVTASGGAEALEGLEGSRPDVVLLDVMMPGLDGFEVCRRFKALSAWRHVPVILLSALDAKEDVARGLESGADDFLSKPVNGLELRARVRSMLRIKRQHDELASLAQLRDDLVHMIVHDMRTPLTLIAAYCDVAQRKAASGDAGRAIHEIESAGRRLDQFVRDLLLTAKLEAGKLVPDRKPAEVAGLVREVERGQRTIAEFRGITLTVEAPGDGTTAEIDAHLFQRVLDNLLANALKFSPRESTVSVCVGVTEGRVRIEVKDQGPGIPESQRGQLFEKFGIVAAKKAGTAQLGLGLAFCKLVAGAHGGAITFTPNTPCGSVFTVEL